MQFFTVHLPVKGYIRKYLQSTYGADIHIPSSNTFSDVVLSMLATKLHCKLGKLHLDQQLNRHTDKIRVRLSGDLFYQLPREVSDHSKIRINRYFENLFKEEFCKTVSMMVDFQGMEIKKAIETAADKFGIEIETDISMDALLKMEFRYRTNLKKSIAEMSGQNLLFQKN